MHKRSFRGLVPLKKVSMLRDTHLPNDLLNQESDGLKCKKNILPKLRFSWLKLAWVCFWESDILYPRSSSTLPWFARQAWQGKKLKKKPLISKSPAMPFLFEKCQQSVVCGFGTKKSTRAGCDELSRKALAILLHSHYQLTVVIWFTPKPCQEHRFSKTIFFAGSEKGRKSILLTKEMAPHFAQVLLPSYCRQKLWIVHHHRQLVSHLDRPSKKFSASYLSMPSETSKNTL